MVSVACMIRHKLSNCKQCKQFYTLHLFSKSHWPMGLTFCIWSCHDNGQLIKMLSMACIFLQGKKMNWFWSFDFHKYVHMGGIFFTWFILIVEEYRVINQRQCIWNSMEKTHRICNHLIIANSSANICHLLISKQAQSWL